MGDDLLAKLKTLDDRFARDGRAFAVTMPDEKWRVLPEAPRWLAEIRIQGRNVDDWIELRSHNRDPLVAFSLVMAMRAAVLPKPVEPQVAPVPSFSRAPSFLGS